ncbi:MAG: divalent-cation tolerance protein CutA [Candidatus Helarchaeota archaeon]
MNNFIQVITTAGKKDDAEKIAKILVEKRLAGCVQIVGPISSTYWWKKKIETDEEWLCFIKSDENLFEKIEKAIKEVHPYETPEIIALPIIKGSKEYLKWLNDELSIK